MTIYLRHRSASGGALENFYEYDPERRLVICSIRVASAPRVDVNIRVCSPRKPIVGAHPVYRLGPDSWRISLSCFVSSDQKRMPVPAVHHLKLPLDEIVLTHCTPEICEEFVRI